MLSAEDYLQQVEAFILDAGGVLVREGIISVTPDDTEGALTLVQDQREDDESTVNSPVILRFAQDDMTGSRAPHRLLGFVLAVGYPSGEVLYVEIAIDTSHGWPNWTRYAFQLRDGHNRTIFRYDNFPYHPHVR